MAMTRRKLLKAVGTTGLCGSVLSLEGEQAWASESHEPSPDWKGVLVDIPNCIGCRKCEFACQETAGFDHPPIESFDDRSVFTEFRRPAPDSHTIVNRFTNQYEPTQPLHVKVNCLHCNEPACVSACIVGAFRKQPSGAVTYDAWKCMGCRYCMVACPFQIPTYEYDNALTPQVRKCTLCEGKLEDNGGVPACVRICPNDCLTYGKRSELLRLARERIRANPGMYVDHVYGEHEAGGTSWLYLSNVPFESLGFVNPGSATPPRLTEAIQHGVFKHFMPPAALYGLLGIIMWMGRRKEALAPAEPGIAGRDGAKRGQDRHRSDRVPEPEGAVS